jgi:thiol-disulfide isomerase/thioredoxin
MDQLMTVTLYSRPGCHLCDDMKAVVDRVAEQLPLRIDVVDISNDPQLEARYGLEIPVLLVNGRKAAKYRVREEDLRRMLGATSPSR